MLVNGEFRVVLWPENYAAAYDFYKQVLALPIDHEWDYGVEDTGVVFVAGKGMIELLGRLPGQEYANPRGVGVLVEVDDADHWYALAQERGAAVVQEPVSYPWGQRIVRLQDPDGLVISLFARI